MDPHVHRLFGTPGQSSKEGLRPVLPSVDANLRTGQATRLAVMQADIFGNTWQKSAFL